MAVDQAERKAGSEGGKPGAAPGWKAAVVREIKGRPFAYGVLAAFVVLGPIITLMIFPDAPPAAAIIGGLAFGVYGALCAVPQKFM